MGYRDICVFCTHARMRTDICGTYCVGKYFKRPDGTRDHFEDYYEHKKQLRPYRTFQEVEQPESIFLIRVSDRGISFIEADGGMWRLTARETIKKYLESRLEQEVSEGSVHVVL